jgi:hypothetical protein
MGAETLGVVIKKFDCIVLAVEVFGNRGLTFGLKSTCSVLR